MKKLKLAILKNEVEDDHELWVEACRERSDSIDWEVVDLTRADWLEEVTRGEFDGLLAIPPSETNAFKQLYDERIFILHSVCGLPVYPSMDEIRIFENKKFLAYWLSANGIPHPATQVFYFKNEALDFVSSSSLPLVGKTNIGASGRGVHILKTREAAARYVRQTFSSKGAPRSTGPNFKKKGLLQRAIKKLQQPGAFLARLKYYRYQQSEVQKSFVILQEFVPHEFEWRVVRIGDSFFAHKKMKIGEKASGTLVKGYENPPLSLFDFVKKITDELQLRSQAVDLFETADGRYLVNEMQCIFGQSDPYQMLVDGTPGRYRFSAGHWHFEPGDFNRFESFLLRLDDFTGILLRHPTGIEA